MIGTWVGVLFLSFIAYIGYQSVQPEHKMLPSFPPPMSVGKQRYTGRSRDASMFTQTSRRKAVVSGKYGNPNYVLRESNHTSGFTNGVVELFALTGLCDVACVQPIPPAPVVCQIYDGRYSGDEETNILDGGTSADTYDGGSATQTNTNILNGDGTFVMDGGSAYAALLQYLLLSGGNAQTNVCDV